MVASFLCGRGTGQTTSDVDDAAFDHFHNFFEFEFGNFYSHNGHNAQTPPFLVIYFLQPISCLVRQSGPTGPESK